jgi:hypothetical protein
MKAIIFLLCLVVVAIRSTEQNTFQFYFNDILPHLNPCASKPMYDEAMGKLFVGLTDEPER